MGVITIGITGGIGSGKSVVARILRCNGLYVYDCDAEAKRIMVTSQEVKSILTEKLGNDIYLGDGNLNREKLSKLLFSNNEIRKFVNRVVHKAVRHDIKHRRKQFLSFFFIESAIIETGGIVPLCDIIWLVSAPLEVRIKRLEQRDRIDKDHILKRIESQRKEFRKLESESVILLNDNRHPMMAKVLKNIGKFEIYQNYYISC